MSARPDVAFGFERALRASMALLLFGSWFDRASLATLRDWVFPASRLWASAEATGYALEPFLASNPDAARALVSPFALARTLAGIGALRARAEAAQRDWDALFFHARHADPRHLAAAEARRLRTGRMFLASRFGLAALAARARVPPVAWSIPSEQEALDGVGKALGDPASLFRLPGAPPPVAESARLETRQASEFVLRFTVPESCAGEAQARVLAPRGASGPPTVIHGHGFGMEPDHVNDRLDEFRPLVRLGVRLVRVTAPWHGRRRMSGTWSGEPYIAGVPVSAVAFLRTQVRELEALVAWSRATSRGPVALSGVSMGALTAQLAAVHMASWPPAHRADALFLVGTTDRLDRIAFDSALTCALGLDAALIRAGWTAERLRRFAPLTNPVGAPAVDPANILFVLGGADDVTPFEGGIALAERWRVPLANRFHRRHGHFSLSLGLLHEDTPLRRLAGLLRTVK